MAASSSVTARPRDAVPAPTLAAPRQAALRPDEKKSYSYALAFFSTLRHPTTIFSLAQRQLLQYQFNVMGFNPLSLITSKSPSPRPISTDAFKPEISPAQPAVDKAALLPNEANKLVANLSYYVSMKIIYEILCGSKPDDDSFYFALLEAANAKRITPRGTEQEVSSEEVQTRLYFAFCNKVDELTSLPFSINRFTLSAGKEIIKTAFYFLQPIVFYLFDDFKNQIGKDLQEFLAKNEKDRFEFLKSDIIKHLERYFSVLDGVYDDIVRNDKRGRLDELIKEGVTAPDINGSYTSSELYHTFTKAIIRRYNPSLSLSKVIHTKLEHLRLPPALYLSQLNIVISVITNLLSLLTGVILYLPEKILNNLFQYGIQSTLKNNSLLDKFLHQRTNSSTHAINTVVRNLLKDLRTSLSKPSVMPAEIKLTPPPLSDIQKRDLENVVRLLFTVFEKSRAASPDELKKKSTLYDRVISFSPFSSFISNFVIREEPLIQSTITSLANAIDTLLRRAPLTDLTFNVTKAFNDTITTARRVSEEEKGNVKRQLDTEVDQLLDVVITRTIQEKLEGEVTKTNLIMPKFVDALKKCTQTFLEDTRMILDVIDTINELSSVTLNTLTQTLLGFPERIIHLDSELTEQAMVQERTAYLNPASRSLLHSYQNRIKEILEGNPIKRAILGIKSNQEKFKILLVKKEQTSQALLTLGNITARITMNASAAISVERAMETPTVTSIGSVMETTRQALVFLFGVLELSDEPLIQFQDLLTSAHVQRKDLDILQTLVPTDPSVSIFLKQKEHKLTSFVLFDQVTRRRDLIATSIAKMSREEDKDLLLAALNKLASSTKENFANNKLEYENLVTRLNVDYTRAYEETMRKLEEKRQELVAVVTECQRNNDEEIKDSLREMKEQVTACRTVLGEIELLKENLRAPKIWNFSLPAKRLSPIASRVQPMIKAKIQPALGFIGEPRNYLYGIVHSIMRDFVGDKPNHRR